MIAKHPDPHGVRCNAVLNGVVVHKRAIGNKTRVGLWITLLLGNRIRDVLLEKSVE